MKYSSELKVGITVIVAIVVAYAGFRFMRDLPILQTNAYYYIIYPAVEGLTTGKSVFLNGVDVGKVQAIRLMENDSVEVRVTLDSAQDIPNDSKAYLRSIDLLGSKAIAIEKGTSFQMLKNGGFITGAFDDDALGELTKKGISISGNLDETMVRVRSIAGSVDSLLDEEFHTKVQGMVKEFHGISKNINQTVETKRTSIESSIEALESILLNVDTLSSSSKVRIEHILARLDSSSVQLDALSRNLVSTTAELDTLLGKINRGEGTLGRLANDPRLYDDVDSLVVNINRLLTDFQDNPKRFLKHLRLVRLF